MSVVLKFSAFRRCRKLMDENNVCGPLIDYNEKR